MTEQRSASVAGNSAGAKAEMSVALDDVQRNDIEHRITAQSVWRFLIVGVMVVVGIAVGFDVGVSIVGNYGANGGESSGTFLFDLHRVLQNPYYGNLDKVLFTVLGGLAAYLVGSAAFTRIVAIAENVKNLRANEKVALFVGLLCGLILTLLFGQLLTNIPNHQIGWLLTVFLGVALIYICIGVTFSMKDSFGRLAGGVANPVYEPSAAGVVTSSQIKILDTNVIIDGRVSDVCRTGFIEGTIYVPGFVLDELQHIADSSDSLKRARGRRGLDILNQMRSELSLLVRSLDAKAEAAPHEEVDSKLVKLAKKLGGAIVTNDFNLNKVAELQGVPVLNINELANALKPVVLPGEEMSVAVIKEGKEMSQGIGYLDDGTMIVIEGARRRIGETLDVVVSSVLQTVAGKMIFAQIKAGHDDGYEPENGDGSQDSGQGPRSYSGGRRGARFGTAENKIFALLAGRPVIAHTVARFDGIVDSVTVIGRSDELERLAQACGGDAVSFCAGGDTRQESVRLGLASLTADPDDVILVHDGARPLVPGSVIERCIDAVRAHGSSVAALPISETIKLAGEDGRVASTRARDRLSCAQTPQGATAAILRQAFELAGRDGFIGTDESSLIERLTGCRPPKLVMGARENVKITTREDFEFAERWLAARHAATPAIRVGMGYDIHRFAPKRKLMLGGVEIPSEAGLLGHSDADVVLHAICDALLGAAGLPDIGCLFPNTDDRYAGVSSVELLEAVVSRLRAAGYRVGNVDCCIIAERPRISLYASKMRATIAAATQTDENCVSIKATTNEGIGALGAGEGIACQATAVIFAC